MRKANLFLLAAALFLPVFAAPPAKKAAQAPIAKAAPKPAAAKGPAAKPAPKRLSSSAEEGAAVRWLRSMTLREKIAQLVVIPFSGHPINTRSKEYRKFVRLVQQEHVGGLILVNVSNGRVVAKANPLEASSFINRMQRLSKVPLIVAGDFERGASMRVDATTTFPHAMAFTASREPEEARLEGEITAREARAMGVQWIFFPDADVNNNPDNPIINIRSYGENPDDVSAFVSAFIEGAHSVPNAKVLVTAKHFPGHGDTATDSHLNLATIPGDLERLNQVEFAPFRAAIKSGVDSIMTAHLAVPAIEDPSIPATLSTKILSGLLRDQLSFRGIIVTDALDMGGIGQGFAPGDAAVRAIEAGADILLMPPDAEAAINAVQAAVKSGRITQKRIESSVLRLLAAKASLGLSQKKLVDLEEVHTVVDSVESNAVAQRIADRSVTLVKNEGAAVPLRTPSSTAFFALTEGRASVEGLAFNTELRRHGQNGNVTILDASESEGDLDAALQRQSQADEYVVAAFVSVAAYRGNVALAGNFPRFVEKLIASGKPVTLISLGNPYLLRNFPGVSSYLTTYSTVPPSEVSVVKALFGEIDIRGKLPVSIPGHATYGDGIMVEATHPALPGNAAGTR